MKKIISILLIVAGVSALAVSCKKEQRQQPVQISIQLFCDGAEFQAEGVSVTLTDASGAATYEEKTNETGLVQFVVPVGAYTASALHKEVINGERIAYNGSNNNIVVSNGILEPFQIVLNKVISQQIIIKEFYHAGCPSDDGASSYAADQYVILYNNSADPADASNIVFAHGMPYEAATDNAYYNEDGVLAYENDTWIPAGSAIWWFTSQVVIPPYSQIVVVFKRAIDHTQTVAASVDLSDPSYYWMSNQGIPVYGMGNNYQVAETIPASNYLTASVFGMTPSGWALSTSTPAFYIGKMPKEEAKALCEDKSSHDQTLGGGAFAVAKFPKASFVDGIEIWAPGNEETSHVRFSADVNTGYLIVTPKLGYSAYRNVDKEATEALPENEGKLVYNYAGGTGSEEEGNLSTDPSGIDAEASIANGAHIIYSETNNTSLDFHQRKVASLKK